MKNLALVFTVLAFIGLVLGCGADHTAGTTNSSSLGPGSVLSFEKNLAPILSKNCGSCHGAGQSPLFAVADVELSHDAVIKFSLASLTTPNSSRLVTKVQSGHQGFPVSLAAEIELAITAWAKELEDSGGTVPQPAILEATFSSIHELILVPKCLGCHNPNGERPGENYTNYSTTMATGGVKKNDSQDSSMYKECRDGSMPEDAPELSEEEKSAMKTWIDEGALNN